MLNGFLNMRQRVLYRSIINMRNSWVSLFRLFSHLQAFFHSLHRSLPMERGNRNDLAPDLFAKCLEINLSSGLFYHVHHVDGDNDGNSDLQKLGGKVQISLQIGTIHDIQNDIRLLVNQIISRNHFLRGVRGKRVDTGKILDDHILMPLQFSFLLFNGYAWPVTDVLGTSGQIVKQRCFPAVRVSGKCNF